MLILQQSGAVKVGEIVRYTITYTPSADRILPTPSHLHLKIRNTSAIPLRAAYLHGPYTLHVAAYPSTFNPHVPVADPQRTGEPEFEPNLKAGGTWSARLVVPEDIRISGHNAPRRTVGGPASSPRSPNRSRSPRWPTGHPEQAGENGATWIVEVTSQILFSQSASVGFELLLGRDERSVEMGVATVIGGGPGNRGLSDGQGHVADVQQGKHRDSHSGVRKGIYSRAIDLVVDDTTSLWNKPQLPDWGEGGRKSRDVGIRKSLEHVKSRKSTDARKESVTERKQRKVHLVLLTHGMHSNLGADMIFLKESIDSTAKQARQRRRKAKQEANGSANGSAEEVQVDERPATGISTGGQEDLDRDEDSDEEDVVVRGYPGNAVRTERGIQYLGKRLAKYVLNLTYPDQPYRPVKRSVSSRLTNTFGTKSTGPGSEHGVPTHSQSTVHKDDEKVQRRAYRYTSISFVGHSLGGLVQTYAMAYIHKHSPTFFETIRPINYVAMASPMLGLSNENPIYVKFALDFGLVGRTGQDLGLTWRAPNLARSGWSAVVGGLGAGNTKEASKHEDPRSKPLLRILPAGPAHQVLRMFRNRTLYSNVVNDGIVPLRTSCLLFLDWKGLGRVEKARRENGLIGTMAGWGWAELMGQNSSLQALNAKDEGRLKGKDPAAPALSDDGVSGLPGRANEVPLPSQDFTDEDHEAQLVADPQASQFLRSPDAGKAGAGSGGGSGSALDGFLNFFRPKPSERKESKMYRRSQTVGFGSASSSAPNSDTESGQSAAEDSAAGPTSDPVALKRPSASRKDSVPQPYGSDRLAPPPRTTFLESAGDVLNPPLPSRSFINDPSSRPLTIFHDRVYHPDDIPPPPLPRPRSSRIARSSPSSESVSRASTMQSDQGGDMHTNNQPPMAPGSSGMRVEEKIARAYHRDLSWRKVLVRLEPDAHNNMFVRRAFANAHGWPVVKHLCDTHFSDSYAACTRDEYEPGRDRSVVPADDDDASADPTQDNTATAGDVTPRPASVLPAGEEVHGQRDPHPPTRQTTREKREAADELAPLRSDTDPAVSDRPPTLPPVRAGLTREDSALWDDLYFEGGTTSDDDDDSADENAGPEARQRQQHANRGASPGALARLFTPGKQRATTAAPAGDDDEAAPGTSPAQIADFLSASPSTADHHRNSSGGGGSVEAHRGLGVVRSPPATPEKARVPSSPTTAERQSPSVGTSELGLRKSVEEQMASPTKEGRKARSRPGTAGSGGAGKGVVQDVVNRAAAGSGG